MWREADFDPDQPRDERGRWIHKHRKPEHDKDHNPDWKVTRHPKSLEPIAHTDHGEPAYRLINAKDSKHHVVRCHHCGEPVDVYADDEYNSCENCGYRMSFHNKDDMLHSLTKDDDWHEHKKKKSRRFWGSFNAGRYLRQNGWEKLKSTNHGDQYTWTDPRGVLHTVGHSRNNPAVEQYLKQDLRRCMSGQCPHTREAQTPEPPPIERPLKSNDRVVWGDKVWTVAAVADDLAEVYSPEGKMEIAPVRELALARRKTAEEVNGYTNWDTFETAIMIDNEQETQQKAHKIVEQGMAQGLSDEEIAKKLRAWADRKIVGPYNQDRMRDAQEWNDIPEEERIDHNYEEFKDKYGDDPKSMDVFHGLVGGPDVSDYTPDLIDSEIVNWLELVQGIKDTFAENQMYEDSENRYRDMGISWTAPGHKDDVNQARDAFYRWYGAVPEEDLKAEGAKWGDPRAYYNINVDVPYEHMQGGHFGSWPDNWLDHTTRAKLWNVPGFDHKNPNWDDPEVQALVNEDPNVKEMRETGYKPMRLHDVWDSAWWGVTHGHPDNPYVEILRQALEARGYTPEQIQYIMRQRWQWDPETQEHIDLEPRQPAPPDPTLDQPGDFTLPEDWHTGSQHSATDWDEVLDYSQDDADEDYYTHRRPFLVEMADPHNPEPYVWIGETGNFHIDSPMYGRLKEPYYGEIWENVNPPHFVPAQAPDPDADATAKAHAERTYYQQQGIEKRASDGADYWTQSQDDWWGTQNDSLFNVNVPGETPGLRTDEEADSLHCPRCNGPMHGLECPTCGFKKVAKDLPPSMDPSRLWLEDDDLRDFDQYMDDKSKGYPEWDGREGRFPYIVNDEGKVYIGPEGGAHQMIEWNHFDANAHDACGEILHKPGTQPWVNHYWGGPEDVEERALAAYNNGERMPGTYQDWMHLRDPLRDPDTGLPRIGGLVPQDQTHVMPQTDRGTSWDDAQWDADTFLDHEMINEHLKSQGQINQYEDYLKREERRKNAEWPWMGIKEAKVVDLPGEWQSHPDIAPGERTFIYVKPMDTLFLAPNNAYHQDIWDYIYTNYPDDYRKMFFTDKYGPTDHMDISQAALGFLARSWEDQAMDVHMYWDEGENRLPDHIVDELENHIGERVYQRDYQYPPTPTQMNDESWWESQFDWDNWQPETEQWPTNAQEPIDHFGKTAADNVPGAPVSDSGHWVWLDGKVGMGGIHSDIARQLAGQLGYDDTQTNYISNWIARGHCPPDMQVAVGTLKNNYPYIWNSTVDRNHIWDAVKEHVSGPLNRS